MSTMTTSVTTPRTGRPAGPAFHAGTAPAVRVLAGSPDAEELAALVVALTARARAVPVGPGRPTRVDRWSDPARGLGLPPAPGPGAWLASARG